LRLWTTQGGLLAEVPNTDEVLRRLAFSDDGHWLATAGKAGLVCLRDPATGREKKRWQMPGEVSEVRFTSDSRFLLTGNTNGTIAVFGVPR